MTGNLGDKFGGSAVGGLSKRLPPAQRPTRTEPPPTQPPTSLQPNAPEPSSTTPASVEAPTSADAAKHQLSAYVLPHVPDAIQAGKGGRSNALVVWEAIENCQDRLPTLLEARHRPAEPAGGGGLFVRSPSDARREDSQRVSWTFRCDAVNRRTLDELARRYGAKSRSELVSVALEAAYPASE